MLLRDYALRLLALRREASSALGELKSLERGHLQLAANEYTCMYLLPAIDAFRRECPHVNVTVHRMLASRVPEELNLRTFELGVISFKPDPAQFRTIAVYADSLAFIVSPQHPLAAVERVSINDLGSELFVAHNVASPLRRRVIEAFQRYRTPLNMGIELPTIEAIKRFVALGNGVALVPHLTVAHELETGDLVRVFVDELEVRRVLRLVHRRQATLSYAAKAFLQTLQGAGNAHGTSLPFSGGAGGMKVGSRTEFPAPPIHLSFAAAVVNTPEWTFVRLNIAGQSGCALDPLTRSGHLQC